MLQMYSNDALIQIEEILNWSTPQNYGHSKLFSPFLIHCPHVFWVKSGNSIIP